MKTVIPLTLFFRFILPGMIAVILAACQAGTSNNYGLAQSPDKTSMRQQSTSENTKFCNMPKTGQKIVHMQADDGDLRTGRKWPNPRFIDNGNGTISDLLTGLMWTKNADMAQGTVDWEEAVQQAVACKEGGHQDWRLPNRNELASLIDLGKFDPALPENNRFSGVQSSYYWTSTTPANGEDGAWVIHFYIGFITHDDKGGTHYVWYVRNWQSN